MNIYENKDKNAIRLLAVLVLGIFLVSVMPTPPANETETPLTTRTPTITNDALEFFNSYVEEVQNTEPKTAWQRLDSALQTYVDTGTPTPEMYLIKGHPHVLIVAVPGFDVASLPAGLDIGRVAPLPFMTVIEATVTEPDLLLQTAAVEGVAEIDADVYLLGTRPVAPTLEAKPEPVNLADRAMDWARELLQEDGRIAPTRQDVRELTGVETITTAGYDGSGVLVAIDDSGVDFGLPNLAPAIDIDTAGYPTSYDDGGEGLLYAPIPAHETPSGVIPADESWDDYPLQRNFDGSPDQAFSIWEYWYYLGTPINSGPDGAWQSATVPTGVSKSGVWKFGWARHGPAGNYRWVASAFCDPYTAGVYERMYIDWETSWAVTMEYYGLTSWESTSTINWNLLDEHAAGDYWDMRLTPQQALGIDPDGAGPLTGEGPSAWAVSHDYWNGTFFGFGTYGQHVDTTLEYAHTQTAANNFTSIIMEYCWLDNPYYPITNAVNRFNVTMDTATAAGTITGSYVLNGLFDAGDIIHHRFYGLNVSGDMVAIGGSEWQNWTVNAVDNTDGYVDMSLGALAHTYDLADLAPSYDYIAFMTGDPDETYGALMWDMLNHGTWCAIDVAARGHVDDPSIPLYDVFLNGSATYDIRGQAPGASVLATKTYTSGNYFWNFMWINALSGRGSDYEAWSGSYVNLNPWADQYSGMWLGYDDAFVGGIYMEFSDYYNHQANYNPADIVSLSWGYLSWAPYAWVDMLFEGTSLAGTDSPFGATWPGVLYTTGAGNRGPGYGSATGPGSPLMLHVGAATSFHTLDNFYGPNQWSNELVGFQDRGPSTYGGHSADILTYGQSETTLTKVHDVWSGYLGVASWSGTSMSNPIAAGSIAALKDAARTIRSYEPTPVELKNLVMSTAQDMGADAYTQGCGLLDLGEAYNFIVGGSSEELMYTDASQYAARLADAVHDFWLENMGISYIRHDAGMEASYFTGVMMPGESQNFSIFRTDDTGGAAISAGGVVTGAPSDGNTHILNQTSIKTAMFSNNATWDSGSLTSRYNTTTGAQTAWNLTELLWGNAAALTTWASYEDGWVAFQINTDANAATYFFLHAWEDLDSDGLLEYMNATYTDPTAEDWWNSYVVYYDGEAHRIQLSNQNYPQTTMWVRASTLAALEAGGYTLALVEGTGFHPDADAGSFTDLNYTIWAEFYAVEDWSWVTTDTTANTDNSYNVTIDVPASAEPGFYEGFVQYEAGGATFPITINVGATLTEYNATETAGGPAPIITNEYLPGMGYDSA
ncbi:MAG: S8 family serine peptidase, partial [Candidatus Thorarchaeota archaeon]